MSVGGSIASQSKHGQIMRSRNLKMIGSWIVNCRIKVGVGAVIYGYGQTVVALPAVVSGCRDVNWAESSRGSSARLGS